MCPLDFSLAFGKMFGVDDLEDLGSTREQTTELEEVTLWAN